MRAHKTRADEIQKPAGTRPDRTCHLLVPKKTGLKKTGKQTRDRRGQTIPILLPAGRHQTRPSPFAGVLRSGAGNAETALYPKKKQGLHKPVNGRCPKGKIS
jgi:hypothetical protein